ncbi:MAG: transposase [Pirellulales bacterium]|nr:transposase [Pirellulales bacterium]
MARLARVVAAGMPHHITQRGNRRQPTFFRDEDYVEYLELMAEWTHECDVAVWAYCLMPNHVHLIAVPKRADGLRRAIGEAHRRYTRYVNFREGWRGHLWQGRFASFVMDEPYLLAAARYIELNPVRAGLADSPRAYRWSSARAHLRGKDDLLAKVEPLLALAENWRRLLTSAASEEKLKLFRAHETTGRVLGDGEFQKRLEKKLGRVLRRQKPGPKG